MFFLFSRFWFLFHVHQKDSASSRRGVEVGIRHTNNTGLLGDGKAGLASRQGPRGPPPFPPGNKASLRDY